METPETTARLVSHAIDCCVTVIEREGTDPAVRAWAAIAKTALEAAAMAFHEACERTAA